MIIFFQMNQRLHQSRNNIRKYLRINDLSIICNLLKIFLECVFRSLYDGIELHTDWAQTMRLDRMRIYES